MFRDWERLQLRASDYKNHKIFTLRCLHKELIPVSIKLKSTLKTERARKIIRKADKDLLQARIKAINSILDNIAKQTEECRSQLASIISAQRLRECQGFIDKVGEIRFTKVKERQSNKYNILLNKKEGNITRANATTNPSNLASQQAGRLVLSFPPGKEAIYLKQTGRQSLPFPLGKEAIYLRQAGRQVLSFPLGKEAIHHRQVVRQVLSFLLGKEAISPWQLLTFLLGKEAILPQQLLTFPLGKQAVPPRLLLTLPLRKQAVLPRQLLTFLLGKGTVLPSQPPFLPPGREVTTLRQAIKLGQAGRPLGILPGIGHPRLPRGTALPPR